ncbi:MAG TPA: hypothetical protein DEQ88_04405, partial [Clostridiales bacterium]|nr:hypothetical protein [Clostridiales bacterium]
MRVVAVREAHNELVCLRKLRSVADFLVGRVRVTPPEVFGDSAGKQQIFLQHESHLVSEGF